MVIYYCQILRQHTHEFRWYVIVIDVFPISCRCDWPWRGHIYFLLLPITPFNATSRQLSFVNMARYSNLSQSQCVTYHKFLHFLTCTATPLTQFSKYICTAQPRYVICYPFREQCQALWHQLAGKGREWPTGSTCGAWCHAGCWARVCWGWRCLG